MKITYFTWHSTHEKLDLHRQDRSVSIVMEKVVVPALFFTFNWWEITFMNDGEVEAEDI